MNRQAFKILGITETSDLRDVRDAFMRLARIYHPDRFAGMGDDVRAEAERRMKEASAAYDGIRTAIQSRSQTGETQATKSTESMLDKARKMLAAVEARRAEEEASRRRWQRWDELEREARDRARLEAEVLSRCATFTDGDAIELRKPLAELGTASRQSEFARRLEQAREAKQSPTQPVPSRRPEATSGSRFGDSAPRTGDERMTSVG